MQFTHREFPYSFWALALPAQRAGRQAGPEHARAHKQFQWKPIAGYLNAGTGDQRANLKIA
jgi:hypothetical protein